MTPSTASLSITIRPGDSTGPLPVDLPAISEAIALAVRDSYSPGGINLCGYAEVGALIVQLNINGVEYDEMGIADPAPAPLTPEAVEPTPVPCGLCCGSGAVAYGPWGVNPPKRRCEKCGGSGVAPNGRHDTWSKGCTIPTEDRANGDARDAHAVCPVCEPGTSPASSSSIVPTPGPAQ